MAAIPARRKLLRTRKKMGLSFVDLEVENVRQPRKTATVRDVLVDTGSLNSWLPAQLLKQLGVQIIKAEETFVTANGQEVSRPIGMAVLRAAGFTTVDEVVFAQPGDLNLLGARTLEGFGAVVDPRKEKIVAAGPKPAASSIQRKIRNRS